MSERESTVKTLAVAAGVALVCSLLVSTAVYWLRPIQLASGGIERNRAILDAAGLADSTETLPDREVLDRFGEFDPEIVDLASGRLVERAAPSYDYRGALDDPAQTVAIPADADIAGLGSRPRTMPVYILRRGRQIERIVLPVYGRGMWSTIHGFIGLEGDLATIAGVRFYELGETPGIGDRIQDPAWTAKWRGKRIYAEDGTLRFRIGRADAAGADFRVDAITGATVTVTAVDRFVRYWLGPDGYAPLLERLRGEGG